jgi:hypothetical protein
VVGPEIRIYYPSDGGFGLYVPVTFLNHSPRTGTIWRCAITLFAKNSGERFFMGWRYFFRIKPEGTGFNYDEIASAFAVPGNQSLSKLIWFLWRSFSTPPLLIGAGEYVIVFHYWTGPTRMPHNESHDFSIDQAIYAQLEDAPIKKSNSVFDITLDRTLAANLVMSSRDATDRLGVE